MDTPSRSWAIDRPVTSPFALPRGVRGRLAGRFMLWTNRQRDLLEILRVRPGQRVLEVGYGPGGLVRLLVEHTDAAHIHGVDPGLRELHRVLRHGGTLVIAWHGGTSPSRIAKSLRLPEDRLRHIETALQALFTDVTRHQLNSLDVFTATA